MERLCETMLLDTQWHEGVDALPEALGNASKLVVCLGNHWKDIAFEQFPNLVLAASERKPGRKHWSPHGVG